MKLKSLKRQNAPLASPSFQLKVLNELEEITFEDKLDVLGNVPLSPASIDTLQVNVGKMCNQTCAHCHVDAGPDRQEIMTRETMQQCLEAIERHSIKCLDITGGAPEMNPNFRWFVEEARARRAHVIVRCNLTIILANRVYYDLPEFFARNKVEVISSLPHFSALRTDRQRGEGVFDKSVQALIQLNEAGYGMEDSVLEINLVYNPSGAFLPPEQKSLERDFRRKLMKRYGIRFNRLFTITNMPISRFLDYLIKSGNYEEYMNKLVQSFNPLAVEGLMCRSMISVGWDGKLFDCDFNQMLDIPVAARESRHICDFDPQMLLDRVIVTGKHCFGCTAGAGSSCGGEIV